MTHPDDVALGHLADAARQEIPKELARRGIAACRTCDSWADVIHTEFDGRLEERWHNWEAHGGKCPACGRVPRVVVVRFAYDDPGSQAA